MGRVEEQWDYDHPVREDKPEQVTLDVRDVLALREKAAALDALERLVQDTDPDSSVELWYGGDAPDVMFFAVDQHGFDENKLRDVRVARGEGVTLAQAIRDAVYDAARRSGR